MSEFNAGRQGPFPLGDREEAQRAHEQDLREEAEHERDVKVAEVPLRVGALGGRSAVAAADSG